MVLIWIFSVQWQKSNSGFQVLLWACDRVFYIEFDVLNCRNMSKNDKRYGRCNIVAGWVQKCYINRYIRYSSASWKTMHWSSSVNLLTYWAWGLFSFYHRPQKFKSLFHPYATCGPCLKYLIKGINQKSHEPLEPSMADDVRVVLRTWHMTPSVTLYNDVEFKGV